MLKLVIDMNEATQTRYLDFVEDMNRSGYIMTDSSGYFTFRSFSVEISDRFNKYKH